MYFPNKAQENHEENFTAFRTEGYIYPPDKYLKFVFWPYLLFDTILSWSCQVLRFAFWSILLLLSNVFMIY